jgi:hypothetical protein
MRLSKRRIFCLWRAGVLGLGAGAYRGGVTRLDGRGEGAAWRVFISHTSELQKFPRLKSYVAEVKGAISAAGHVVVDMADFPAADQPPAQLCAERVRGCNVYVGVLGTCYGSPVRDRPEVSYTELEFDTATQAGLDRLVFLLDTDSDDVGIPLSALIDHEFGPRQEAFRRRVQSGLTTQSFANPAKLGQLVERSLRELAETQRRIDSGIVREQVPAQPPVRASRFVNPQPDTVPAWFQDRQIETGLLARYLTDRGIRLVWVVGRGGIGKTAMVCRLLSELEAGRMPDMAGGFAAIAAGGIVYLGPNGEHKVQYPTLVSDLLRLLPADVAQRLQRIQQDPHRTPAELMRALLEAFPAGDPVVVLLDNLESVMDTERETLTEQALHQALSTVLTAPAHAVTVIATTRVTPTALLKVEPGKQHKLPLEEGLGSPDAQTVLRALDDDGRLGLRDAPDELLDGLRLHTRGFPRALEAVKAILEIDETLTPRDLLDRTRHLPEDQVVQVLVGEAYDLLDMPARQVMQALSVYPAPVSAVGVDFLLRPVNPTTDAAPILTRLVGRQLVRFQGRRYYLHPVDRDYACSQLPPGSPGDSPAAFTLTGLRARAAVYLGQQGSYASAVELQKQHLDSLEQALGPEHPDTLTACARLAGWVGQAGGPAAARDRFIELLPIVERVLGREHPETLKVRASLADWIGQAGGPAAARDRFIKLLPIVERVLGREHPETLKVRAGLARWTGEGADPAEARDQFTELLPIMVRVLGQEDPETLKVRASVAGWTGSAYNPAGARDEFAKLLPADEEVFGADHPETLSVRASLARWTGEAGAPDRARGQFTQLLPDLGRVLGPEHPDTLTARANLAHWTGEAGAAITAQDEFAALLDDLKRVLGTEHPDTFRARAGVARWTGEAGDPDTARDQFTQLLRDVRRVLGPKHWETLRISAGVARWTGEAGDPAAARDQFTKLLPALKRVWGAGHLETFRARAGLACYTGQAGDPAGARDQFTRLLPDIEHVLGPGHPETLRTRAGLACWTGEAGDPAGARDQFTRLLPDIEQVLGPGHPDTLTARADLTRWTSEAGDPGQRPRQ